MLFAEVEEKEGDKIADEETVNRRRHIMSKPEW